MFSASRLGRASQQLTGVARRRLTVCELSKLDGGAANVFANGRGHSRKLGLGGTFGVALKQALFRLYSSWW